MFAENRVEALQTQAIHLEEEKQAILVKQPKIKDYRKMIDSLPALQASFSWRNVAQSYADFIDLEAKFLTEIQWFAYDGKKITSQFKFRGSSTTTSETASARILRFLDAYKQGVGPNGFTLKPISTISGDESERNISVELTLP
jgi:hypothetical protein